MAVHKEQFGHTDGWIGYDISNTATEISIQIKAEFMLNLKMKTNEFQKTNLIKTKELRTYTGRANHVANLLFAWKPFLDTLWAATAGSACSLKNRRTSRARTGMTWTKQVRSSLDWLAIFLEAEPGALRRSWELDHFRTPASSLTMVLDASPFGFGGALYEEGRPVAFFHDIIDDHDQRIHHHKRGDHKGQQVWECLVVLIALRVWKDRWVKRRSSITIRSDNMSALALACRLKTSAASRLIGKEIAMVYTSAAFEPKVVEHISGITNTVADALSRIGDGSGAFEVPDELAHLVKTPVPVRDESFYTTLAAKQVGRKG